MRGAWLLATLLVACNGPAALPDVVLVTVEGWQRPAPGAAFAEPGGLPDGFLLDAVAASPRSVASLASIHTGRLPRDHSIRQGSRPRRLRGETTLAESFRRAGYHTLALWQPGFRGRDWGLDRGYASVVTGSELRTGLEKPTPLMLWMHLASFTQDDRHTLEALLAGFPRGERPWAVTLVGVPGGDGRDGPEASTTPDAAVVSWWLAASQRRAGQAEALAHHVDIAPTLLELADVPGRGQTTGVSFAGFAAGGPAPDPGRVLYCDAGSEVSAYFGDAFIRVRFSKAGARGATEWHQYRWERDGSWEKAPLEVARLSSVRQYLGVPVEEAPEP